MFQFCPTARVVNYSAPQTNWLTYFVQFFVLRSPHSEDLISLDGARIALVNVYMNVYFIFKVEFV